MTEHVLTLAEIMAQMQGPRFLPPKNSEPADLTVIERIKGASKAVKANRKRYAKAFSCKREKPRPTPRPRKTIKIASKPRFPRLVKAPNSQPPRPTLVAHLDRDQMEALYAKHGSWSVVAKVLKCSNQSVSKHARKVGATGPRQYGGLDRDALQAALDEHGSWNAVAKALNLGKTTLLRTARAMGLAIRHYQKSSDADLLAAYDKAGSGYGAAKLLGQSGNGRFNKRLQRLLAQREAAR